MDFKDTFKFRFGSKSRIERMAWAVLTIVLLWAVGIVLVPVLLVFYLTVDAVKTAAYTLLGMASLSLQLIQENRED